MKTYKENCILLNYEYKTSSIYGNPSYWVYAEDSNGNFFKGYTASNSSSGYGIRNYKKNQKVIITYHITNKSQNIIIDRIEEDRSR